MTRPLWIHGLDAGPMRDGPRSLLIEDGRIVALDGQTTGIATSDAIDGRGLFAAPGFIDLQVNGVAGHDFTSEPASMWDVGCELARYGVTAFVPTIVTSPSGSIEAALRAFEARPRTNGAEPLGLHVEGPFLSPERRGAHRVDLLRPPDLHEIRAWFGGGSLRILTLAPELPGAPEAIEAAAAAGVVVAIGHTDADAATATRALERGARYATHLFNAMPPLGHRAPGAAGALLLDERVVLGLVADGRHLDPLVLQLVARVAPHRVSLVSDAIGALGLADGTHRLGTEPVTVEDGEARLADGTLAGSVVGLDACVRGFADATGSVAPAIEAVTATPARLLGLDDRGALRAGARADVVLLDAGLEVRATLVGGEVAFDRDGRWQSST